MSLNYDYKGKIEPDNLFWRELGVSIDSIMELSEPVVDSLLKPMFERQKNEVLQELCTLYGLEIPDKKENGVITLLKMTLENKREILILQDYKNRRKYSIDTYYKGKYSKEKVLFNSSTLTQLKHMLNISINNMIEVYTLYSWDIKGTGDQYTYEYGISQEEALKIPTTYRDDLINELYKGSGQSKKYKVFSYTHFGSKVIIILYKQVNDTPRPDFDKAVRNKEVVPLIFCIDVKDKLIEIKGASVKDKSNLVKYFQSNFERCNPIPIKHNVFENYDKEAVIKAFLKGVPPGDAEVTDFVVNKIVFRDSPIKNSPKVLLELENEDIWPSVIYAYNNNCINLDSLKDIEGLTIKSGGKSRGVRSIILDNGNVLFTMDDSRLDSETKKTIISNFNKKFGIPLNQEIANSKFQAGRADKVDFILGTKKWENLDTIEAEILTELKAKSFIDSVEKDYFYCKGCKLEKEITKELDIKEGCPECGSEDLITKVKSEHIINIRTIKSFVRKSLKELNEWEIKKGESNIAFDDKEHYNFFNLKHLENDEILQVLVTDQSLPISVVNRLKTMMTPTIIIFIGHLEKFVHSYNVDCLQSITFGHLYTTDVQQFSNIYSQLIAKLKLRLKSYVAVAASTAAMSLSELQVNPSLASTKKYTDKKFEDDIYAILKDLFPNSAKWGKEASGKALPEGIFAITHFRKGPQETEIKRVFSYDCKLNTDNKGYNLSKAEQRKAVDYVEKLNDNDIIINFSDKKELTGHIFISNKFQEVQFSTMQKHFYDSLGDASNAKPIFITIDVILKLHNLYRENFEFLSNSRNVFSKQLITLFSKEIITEEDIDALFKRVLNKGLQEYDQLDTEAVSEFIDDL